MKKKFVITILMVITLISVFWTIILVVIAVNRKSPSVSLMDIRKETDDVVAKPNTLMMIRDLNLKGQRLSQGDTLKAVYNLINVGEDTLFILNVNPDCTIVR